MVDLQAYLQALITALRRVYGERLVYVGLQGSYLRGEAGEDSDVDVMTVIEALSPSDLRRYRALLETLGIHIKACGFLCGRDELRHWNRLELCHLLHTTRDCFGVLSGASPALHGGGYAGIHTAESEQSVPRNLSPLCV